MTHKVIIAGGGTGGHIFPAIAIARALEEKEPGIQLLFVGAENKMEMEKVPQAGYEIKGLDIVGMNRGQWWKNISLPFKLIKSLNQAKNILKSFKPDAVVGVGGYASFPVLKMAQRSNIPTIIQEQNSYAGKANKILGKKAKKICVAYEHMDRFFPKGNIIYTGNPVRKNIRFPQGGQKRAKENFGLQLDKKTLFIVGGSLGARSINEAIMSGIKQLTDADIQLIWQCGETSYKAVSEAVKGYEEQIKIFVFIKEIERAYEAADVVISRAGAIAISELSVVGKPVIFVPYPYAAEDHQTQNALALVHKKAALMVANHEADKQLVTKVLELFKDTELEQALSKQLKKLAITNADDLIAEAILETI